MTGSSRSNPFSLGRQFPLWALALLFSLLAGSASALPTEWQQVEAGTLFLQTESSSQLSSSAQRDAVQTPAEVTFVAPLLHTEVEIDVTGIIARATVIQEFSNPSQYWVEATYVFPLPENAAVDQMEMRIGERVIVGEIREKGEAKKIYERARAEGKRASLLEQNRPNLFTTRVANVAPGETVQVMIAYQQTVDVLGSDYSIRFPMTFTPRYNPGSMFDAVQSSPPDSEPVATPLGYPGENHHPVSIKVRLAAGFDVEGIESVEHAVRQQALDDRNYRVELDSGSHFANADFILRWRQKPEVMPEVAFFTEEFAGDHYGLLMLTPPRAVAEQVRLPREAIFVIDTSGSMGGESIRQARSALLLALDNLHPEDSFNVIEFNSVTGKLFDNAVPATTNNIQVARRWVSALEARGGTEMASALRAALCASCNGERVRQVMFLTDGAIGNETELFGLIRKNLGTSRLFTVGIGNAPNSYFMSSAARAGRGTFTYIANASETANAMQSLFSRLEAPVMTDIRLELDGAGDAAELPEPIRDLYLGEPLIVALKLNRLPNSIAVNGRLDGQVVRAEIPVEHKNYPGLHVLWARQRIESLTQHYKTVYQPEEKAELRSTTLQLALQHHLVSAFTSLVAVDKTPVRNADQALLHKHLANNLPRGTHRENFVAARTATPARLHLMLGLLCMLFALLSWSGSWQRASSETAALSVGRRRRLWA